LSGFFVERGGKVDEFQEGEDVVASLLGGRVLEALIDGEGDVVADAEPGEE
jgi:hypothetical protein